VAGRTPQEGETYDPDDDEWAAVEEGLAEARRDEFVPDEEMEALWAGYGR
jgi:predicted transcriptional regulator